jgi:hypothetical protein
MTYLSPESYVASRQTYSYQDSNVEFVICATGDLAASGHYHGIFPGEIPTTHPAGVNLRQFEAICGSVFADCNSVRQSGELSPAHIGNLINVICAIVHWKMASQGGRSGTNVANVKRKWTDQTSYQLLSAYQHADLGEYRIGGVRIPTATAIMRFVFPERFGTMDSRVANHHTQPAGITTLSLRADGYITDSVRNIEQYHRQYMPFLKGEAAKLNAAGVTFADIDVHGNRVATYFRPCDIEMALFSLCR